MKQNSAESHHSEINQFILNHKLRNRLIKRLILLNLKLKPCADCNKIYPAWVLEFDHRDQTQKIDNIAKLVNTNCSLTAFLAEIEKTDIVCANCHKSREYFRGNYIPNNSIPNVTKCLICNKRKPKWLLNRHITCHNCHENKLFETGKKSSITTNY